LIVSELNQIPKKRQYRASEVCQLTDTQPYVLRFWESEFPQLCPDKNRGGQPVYRRADIDVVIRIKQLLYEEEYTIEGARQRLEQEMSGEVEAPPRMDDLQEEASVDEVAPSGEEASRPPLIAMAEQSSSGSSLDRSAVERERYDDALEEIAHLRLKVQEIESSARRAEARAEKAEANADRYRDRAHLALTRLERLLESLS
jgi:DNA-binding transcriptional MerR regulator